MQADNLTRVEGKGILEGGSDNQPGRENKVQFNRVLPLLGGLNKFRTVLLFALV